MKDDFYFWWFVLWFSSILVWGWMLTVRTKWIRVWIGGFAIVFNFVIGLGMMSIFSKLSASYNSMSMDKPMTFYDFVINITMLLLAFAPMFVMGSLLRKNGKVFDILQKNQQSNQQNN